MRSRALTGALVLVWLAAACGESTPVEPEASFCDVATGYLELRQDFDTLNQGEDGGSADAEREFWSAARTQAADLSAVAPAEISDDAAIVSRVVAEYDDALAAIDYEIDRLVTDDDPALIDRFAAIDLQASADAGRKIESYYGVACGDLPGVDDLQLEPVTPADLGQAPATQ